MIKQLTLDEATKLTKRSPFPAISLYIPGQGPSKEDAFANEVTRLGLLKKVELHLQKIYSDKETLRRFIEPLKHAIMTFKPRFRKNGIGIFHSDGFTGCVDLPAQTESLAVTADSFHIKPVLRAKHLSQAYYLLILRHNLATLVRVNGSNHNVLDEIPLVKSRAAIRSAGNVAIKAYRRIAGMAPLDETFGNSDRRQSVRRPQDMARALYHKLNMHHQFEPLPFMLAGNHSLVHVAASALESMEVVPNHCVRNFSSVSNLSVAELVAPTMEAHFALQDSLCAKRHDRARIQGMSLSGLHEVAIQLVRGNLTELMIASDRNIWGKLDRLNGKVTVAAKGMDNILQDDLLDDLAEVALAKGVRVTVVPIQQMPDQLSIAAILRPRFTPQAPRLTWAPAPLFAS